MKRSILLVTLLATACSTAREAPAPSPRQGPGGARTTTSETSPGAPSTSGGAQQGGDRAGGGSGDPNPRPYSQVITSSAVTRDGLFKTHRIGSRLYFEIPRRELGKEMLLVTQIARTTLGKGYGGQPAGNRVLRWERRDNRVLLRGISYEIHADTSLPIYRAVQAANYDPVIGAFNVEAWGPDSAAVIEVTRLYTNPPSEFGVGNFLRGSIDAPRTFIERVAAFPTNVEVEATHTWNLQPDPMPGVPPQFQPPPRSASVVMHWSMVKLPDDPMQPRLHDPRVGFFSVEQNDFGSPEHSVQERSFITRWRLEKKDPSAAVSEPVKPIVYYVDPATPAQWVPFVKAGIEQWQPAFEAAGFRNAIVAKDAPTPQEDPDWSPEDARNSVVRWLPSDIENAVGPHVHDPRTGEILEADIMMFHNISKLQRDWYFTQVGHLDPRARVLPLPDSLMGRLIQYVVAHEVGHTLGFPHNQKASATYPADSVRSRTWVRRMGHTPTLMDYSRFNYVAQPEDSIPLSDLIPGVGPYDYFAVKWGYQPIPGARTPEQERPTLSAWASEQDTKPWLRFSTPGTLGADPGDLTEAVGDADAVRSTELGIRNLRRVMPMLIPAAEKPDRDYRELGELYQSLLTQWRIELGHVVGIVGGIDSRERMGRGVRYTPLPEARQREAMRFLAANAWQPPQFLIDTEVLRRLEVEGTMNRIGTAQRQLLNQLMSDSRMRRMVEFEALSPSGAGVYTLAEMLGDLRGALWSELGQGNVRIDPFRRHLQRQFLEVANLKVNPPTPAAGAVAVSFGAPPQPPSSEAKAQIRGELRTLDAQVRSAIARTSDRSTRVHLEDVRDQIDRILNPER